MTLSRLSRRMLLRRAAALGAASLAGALGEVVVGTAPAASPLVRKFETELPIPPVLAPTRSGTEADYYEIVQRPGRARILPGLDTPVWGYNGMFPGPTIRARAGRKTIITDRNRLAQPTVVHLHGGVTPSASDGFPTDLIVPVGFPADLPLCSAVPSLNQIAKSGKPPPTDVKTHVYPNAQRAATLWYHDHAMDFTGRNVYMGLAGFYLVENAEERALALPRGAYDIPLMICVRAFRADGAFDYDNRGHLGAQGDVVLVNGAPWPRLRVERRKYRLRILNACNAQTLTLALGSGRKLVQIATDAGLLPEPIVLDRIPLAMAERSEIVIDFAAYEPGAQEVLHDAEGTLPTSEIMAFEVTGPRPTGDPPLPERLVSFERLRPADAARTRRFDLVNDLELAFNFPPVSWDINGKSFGPDRIDAAPRLGTSEIWHLTHPRSIFPGLSIHPTHIHLVHFQVLERNGAAPPPHETGWKDTVRLAKGDEVKVIARFGPYPGRYVLHCHNLGHEDHHMMARFDVV